MKRSILGALLILSLAASASAANFVTQAVFSITSSAVTATSNLRVTPMTPKTIGRDDNAFGLQWFQWQANQTRNLFLTGGVTSGHSQTVSLADALCAWVQVDQATRVKVNSETPYMILPSGYNGTVCFK